MPTTTAADIRTAIPNSPPPGWERETPLYKVLHKTHPSPNPRMKFEPPASYSSDGSVWNYADRVYLPGETVATRSWPHPAFAPLNFVAKAIMSFSQPARKAAWQDRPTIRAVI
jgi:hypothetical protein